MTLVKVITVEKPQQEHLVEMPQANVGWSAAPTRPDYPWRAWFKELPPNASLTTTRGVELRVRHIISAWVPDYWVEIGSEGSSQEP